jgi:hypothetical protein
MICRLFAVLGGLMILIHIESSFIPAGTALAATLRVVKTHRCVSAALRIDDGHGASRSTSRDKDKAEVYESASD